MRVGKRSKRHLIRISWVELLKSSSAGSVTPAVTACAVCSVENTHIPTFKQTVSSLLSVKLAKSKERTRALQNNFVFCVNRNHLLTVDVSSTKPVLTVTLIIGYLMYTDCVIASEILRSG